MQNLKTSGVSRRSFIKTTAVTAGAVAFVGMQSPAFVFGMEIAQQASGDLALANFEYGLENAAIEAYKAAAGTGLIPQAVLDIALKFVAQHADHQKGWEAEVKRLGGTPQPLVIGKYPDLKSLNDILAFAKTLEEVAVGSYYGAVGKFQSDSLTNIAAAIMPIEAQHVSIFAAALNQDPIPDAFPKGKSDAEINQLATALQIGPPAAPPAPPAPPAPTAPPAPPTGGGSTPPATPPGAPASGVGGAAKGDDYSGIVTATLAALGAAVAGALALNKRNKGEESQEESN